jgi:hypothetical protein
VAERLLKLGESWSTESRRIPNRKIVFMEHRPIQHNERRGTLRLKSDRSVAVEHHIGMAKEHMPGFRISYFTGK